MSDDDVTMNTDENQNINDLPRTTLVLNERVQCSNCYQTRLVARELSVTISPLCKHHKYSCFHRSNVLSVVQERDIASAQKIVMTMSRPANPKVYRASAQQIARIKEHGFAKTNKKKITALIKSLGRQSGTSTDSLICHLYDLAHYDELKKIHPLPNKKTVEATLKNNTMETLVHVGKTNLERLLKDHSVQYAVPTKGLKERHALASRIVRFINGEQVPMATDATNKRKKKKFTIAHTPEAPAATLVASSGTAYTNNKRRTVSSSSSSSSSSSTSMFSKKESKPPAFDTAYRQVTEFAYRTTAKNHNGHGTRAMETSVRHYNAIAGAAIGVSFIVQTNKQNKCIGAPIIIKSKHISTKHLKRALKYALLQLQEAEGDNGNGSSDSDSDSDADEEPVLHMIETETDVRAYSKPFDVAEIKSKRRKPAAPLNGGPGAEAHNTTSM